MDASTVTQRLGIVHAARTEPEMLTDLDTVSFEGTPLPVEFGIRFRRDSKLPSHIHHGLSRDGHH